MARGRHRRRSGLLSRLLPRRRRTTPALPPAPSVRAELARLEHELGRLRALAEASAETTAAALVRAAAAEDLAAAARDRAALAEARLSAATGELAGLRTDLAALREELVWAFAEGKVPVAAPPVAAPTVVDLRGGVAHTA